MSALAIVPGGGLALTTNQEHLRDAKYHRLVPAYTFVLRRAISDRGEPARLWHVTLTLGDGARRATLREQADALQEGARRLFDPRRLHDADRAYLWAYGLDGGGGLHQHAALVTTATEADVLAAARAASRHPHVREGDDLRGLVGYLLYENAAAVPLPRVLGTSKGITQAGAKRAWEAHKRSPAERRQDAEPVRHGSAVVMPRFGQYPRSRAG